MTTPNTPTTPPEMTLPPELAARVQHLLDKGTRQILGIAAAPGAGKSTLAEALFRAFGSAVQVVPMDGFHLANSTLVRLGRRGRKGAPDTFDAYGYVALLKRLKAQHPDEVVYAPDFRRELEEPIAGAIAIDPATRLVVTEGNYLLLDVSPWSAVRGLLDESWYVSVDDTLRRQRLVARHMRFGRSQTDALAWVDNTDEPNARFIAQHRHRADVQVQL